MRINTFRILQTLVLLPAVIVMLPFAGAISFLSIDNETWSEWAGDMLERVGDWVVWLSPVSVSDNRD